MARVVASTSTTGPATLEGRRRMGLVQIASWSLSRLRGVLPSVAASRGVTSMGLGMSGRLEACCAEPAEAVRSEANTSIPRRAGNLANVGMGGDLGEVDGGVVEVVLSVLEDELAVGVSEFA